MGKKIIMTGVSSFTGSHIAKTLRDGGHEVWGVLTNPISMYTEPLLRARINYGNLQHIIDQAPLNSKILRDYFHNNHFDIFINHGWPVSGHREPLSKHSDFIAEAVGCWDTLFDSIKTSNKNMHIIHTGTVFEAGEGGDKNNLAVNDYGIIKSLVWEKVANFTKQYDLRLSKVVIPNPIGPMENPTKLISSFIEEWKHGKIPILNRPKDTFDNICVESLAMVYLKIVDNNLTSTVRPSGLICKNDELIDHVIKAIGKDLKYIKKNADENTTLYRVNSNEPQIALNLTSDTKSMGDLFIPK